MKKLITAAITAILPFSVTLTHLRAEEQTESIGETENVVPEDAGGENDELLMQYLDRKIYGDMTASGAEYQEETYNAPASLGLSDIERRLYFRLVPDLKEVAEGSRTSAEFSFMPEDLGIEPEKWTAEELGVETVLEDDYTVPADVYEKLLEREGAMINVSQVLHSLLTDIPYELYWFEKTAGIDIGRFGVDADFDHGEARIWLKGPYILSFNVAEEYASAKYETDASVISAIQQTPAKVKEVVERHASEDDHAKLDSYRREIIEMTDYNDPANADPDYPYGNPWQLIWVFDGNPDTKVVCEGYAKAFQYLCDLSSFTGNISSVIVSGPMKFGGTQGPHMWNIVTMEDGENYIVDITNCDDGHAGMYDRLFLVGGRKQEDGSYEVTFPDQQIGDYIYYGGTIGYSYDQGTLTARANDPVLNISAENYKKPNDVSSGKCGDDLFWTLDDKGVLTIAGSGSMYDYSEEDPAPWSGASVRKAVISAGTVYVGSFAFYGCAEMTELHLPASVVRIGRSAASGCESLEKLFYYGKNTELRDVWIEPDNDPLFRADAYPSVPVPVPEQLTLAEGEFAELPTTFTLRLTPQVEPEKAEDKVRWISDREGVASVDENGVVTANTYGRAVITAVSLDNPILKTSITIQTRFHDVNDSSQSYYKPVYWGADNGVVAGFSGGEYFGPDEDCTRAQFVTFLWRLAGRPTGTKDVSFPDVDPNANYFRAVKWAVSEGIIVGFKHDNAPATFEPDGVVTRGQVATMLWRYGGRKTPKTGAAFSDVKSSDSIFRAVSWGQEVGIIKGYKTGEFAGQFRPNDSCLRQHIVTFLYRYARDVLDRNVN